VAEKKTQVRPRGTASSKGPKDTKKLEKVGGKGRKFDKGVDDIEKKQNRPRSKSGLKQDKQSVRHQAK